MASGAHGTILVKDGNPVTDETLQATCRSLGVQIKQEERDDYRKLLGNFHDIAEDVMAMEEYIPKVDLDRFPRNNVHVPKQEDNAHNAWASRCSIKDQHAQPDARRLLEGKKFAIKDMIAIKDVPMSWGTNSFKDYIPDTDATVVTRILEAGGEIIGKSTCENLCHDGLSHSAYTGIVENPHAKGYNAGGSSSGNAALLALNEVDMAIGADQGGSVRIPAANCGIVALKPTFGLIPYTACGSGEPTHDHLGPMTTSVLDNARLLQVIAGPDGLDDRCTNTSPIPKYADNLTAEPTSSRNLHGWKIGIITESLTDPILNPRVRSKSLSAASKFTTLGATVSEISIPMHSAGPSIWVGISRPGGYLNRFPGLFGRRSHSLLGLDNLLGPFSQESWENMYVASHSLYLAGSYALQRFPRLYAKAMNLQRNLRDAYNEALETYDVLLTPTLPYIARSHPEKDASPLQSTEKQFGLTVNTCPFNATGHPALALPIGMLEIEEGPLRGSGVKLPTSMQIVGPWWGEEKVYRAAYAWEMGNRWREM
ncbi:MAG: hypothetical protein M1820_007374 [Bogoriella megaspora]|nr:MAG: hypothetical protein M1820_007374 [Bogoriella megaspora]